MINLLQQQWGYKDFVINTTKEELDIDTVHQFLSKESYIGRKASQLKMSKKPIDHTTLCFGMYHINKDMS
ncbi:hypothetical protein MUN88_02060 [Gracilibacillus caseinilyticus]|uniref:Uncharacterized protein n=1 Tax=Gracilibacillus caseinilyticus TaxID=2932256 RepID=A0ABY4EYM1_9BACI|nr:hypothetical protein [Gracilibacillus caseinilyticus]UOQ48947.1 hypothetical protein MUN88_02060 [Gracilibacillus caseinilyticus]